MTPAEAQALVTRLEANGIRQPAARTALEGGSAIALAPAFPSLPAPKPPRKPKAPSPVEVRATAAAHAAPIPPRVAAQLALLRASHREKNPKDKPERVEQVVLAAWLDGLPVFARKWCHVPNERSSARQTARLSQEGVKSGVPDVMIFRRTRMLCPGVAVELKAPSRKRDADPFKGLSDTQRAWGESLLEEGWVWAVCCSAEEAAAIIIREYEGII